MTSSWRFRLIAVAVAGALVLGSCTGDATPKPTPPNPRNGGSVVFAGRFFTECGVNPITCPAVNYNPFSIPRHVLPRAMQFDARGNLVASDLLVEAPTLENGGLTQSPFTVRLKIRPEAIWDDESPITSADFEFSWRALMHTTRPTVYEEGYDRIRSIDATDPQIAVIQLTEPFAQWGNLFGGADGYVLKKAAFPHADPERPDLSKEMQSTIPFSGGPFRLEHVDAGTVVLARNERYFGKRAYLDEVTFVLYSQLEDEPKALRSGRIAALRQEGEYPGVLNQFKQANIRARSANGTYFETLTLNFSTPPLNDPTVREAFMFAIDRRAVLDRLVKPNNPVASLPNCGFGALPDFGRWCRTRPFERFTYDPARARRILEKGGYDCSATICVKAGRPLQITYWAQAARERAIVGQSMAVEHARKAGFGLVEQTFTSSPNPRPWEYPIVEVTLGMYGDPSVTEFLGCDHIPTERKHGNNWMHWCNPEADRFMRESDREIDPGRRLAQMERVYELQAQDFVSLPLYVLPVISAWRTDKIAGPIGRYSSTPYGMFFNMNEWYVPAPAQT